MPRVKQPNPTRRPPASAEEEAERLRVTWRRTQKRTAKIETCCHSIWNNTGYVGYVTGSVDDVEQYMLNSPSLVNVSVIAEPYGASYVYMIPDV